MAGHLEGHPNGPIQTFKGILTNGLGIQPMGEGTVQLSAGASGSVDGITVDGAEIMSAAEAFDTSLAVTAANVTDNINANWKAHVFFATVTTDTITIRQRTAGAIAGVIVSSATTITTVDVNMTGDTDTITTIHSGESAVVLAAKYYQLNIDWAAWTQTTNSVVRDSLDANTLRLVELRFNSDQAVELFAGGISADAGGAPVGLTFAASTEHTIPFMATRNEVPPHMVVKVGTNATWDYRLYYI